MKRKIFVGLMGWLMVIASVSVKADRYLTDPHLTMSTSMYSLSYGSSYSESVFCDTLRWASFFFNQEKEMLALQKDAVATIYCEDEIVVTGTFEVDNIKMREDYYLVSLNVDFEPYLLPKGKIYRLHVPAGVVALESTPSVINKELNRIFEVPAYLPTSTHSIKEGDVVVSKKSDASFIFQAEVRSVDTKDYTEFGTTEIILCRNHIPVRRYTGQITLGGDGGIGYVSVRFNNKTIQFEKGVNYSFILPEGSVCAMYREDLVNKEERITFVGGYEQPFPELKQAWCSLNESETVEVLNEVQWGYTQRVALSLAPQIELRTDADELLKTVVPTLAEVEGEWVMTADFENYAIDPNQVYHLVIPESTVVTPSGDVVVNKETILRIANGVVGIDNATHNTLAMACVNNQLHIEGTNAGDHLALYTIDGKTITTQSAQGTSVVMELPHKGLFIVVVNGKAHKVVNG